MAAKKPLKIATGVVQQFQSGDSLDGPAAGLVESGGPTNLTVGAIADGEILVRSGSSIIGQSGAGLLSQLAPEVSQAAFQVDGSRGGSIVGFGSLATATTTAPGGVTVIQDYNYGLFLHCVSSTVIDSDAGVSLNTIFTRLGSGPVFTVKFRTGPLASDLQNCRIWVGLFSTSPGAADNPAGHFAGIRYNPATDPIGFWTGCVKDGVTLNSVTNIATIALDTTYVLQLDCRTAGQVKFYINGVLVWTAAANTPNPNQQLGAWAFIRSLAIGTARSFRWGRFHALNP